MPISDDDPDTVKTYFLNILHLELAKVSISLYKMHGIGVQSTGHPLNQHFVCLMGECPSYAYTFIIVRIGLDETADRIAPDGSGDDGLAILVELPGSGSSSVCKCPVGSHSFQ
jgi:hypothetical protein